MSTFYCFFPGSVILHGAFGLVWPKTLDKSTIHDNQSQKKHEICDITCQNRLILAFVICQKSSFGGKYIFCTQIDIKYFGLGWDILGLAWIGVYSIGTEKFSKFFNFYLAIFILAHFFQDTRKISLVKTKVQKLN